MGTGQLVRPHGTREDVAGRKRADLIATGVSAQLARRLRDLRDESRLTLRQLAAKTGFSHSALSIAESGRTVPSWDLVAAFVQACGQDADRWRQLWEVAREPAAEELRDESAAAVTAALGSDVGAEAKAKADTDADADTGVDADEDADVVEAGVAPKSRRRAAISLVVAAAAAVVIVTATVLLLTSTSGGTGPTATAHPALPAKDGTDPYDDRCKADEKQLDWQPVQRADRSTFGTIVLVYSPTCEAAWGYLDAPNSTAWTSHIVAHRIPGAATAPSQFGGDAAFGSWGNVLSIQNGCVYIEAYVVDKSGEGPHAKTACMKPVPPTVPR